MAPGKGSAAAEREASQECRALSEGVSGRQEQAAWESGSAEPEMVPCTLEGVKDLAVPNQAPVSVPRHDKVTGILHGVQASQEVLTGTDAQDQVRAEPPSPSLRGMVDDERLSEDEGNGVQDATQEAAPRSPPPLQLVLESQLELSPTAAEELAGLRREIAADLEVQPGGGDEPTPGALCISADLVPDSAPPSPLAASPRLDERPNERLPLLTPRDGAEPWKQPVPVSGGLARARRQVPSPKAVDFTGAQAAEGAGPGQHGSPGASHALLKGSGDRFGDPMPSRSPGKPLPQLLEPMKEMLPQHK